MSLRQLRIWAWLVGLLLLSPAFTWAQGKAPEIIKGTKKISPKPSQAKPAPAEKEGGPPQELAADPDYQQALKQYQAGKYDQAVKAFRQAQKKHPASAELHYQLGLAQAASGDLEQAKASFQEALRLKPDYAAARLGLGKLFGQEGVSLLKQGNSAGAEGPLREAITQNPQDDAAYANLGVALAQQERFREALEALKAAVDLNPNNPKAQFNLGVTYYLLGNKDGASQQYAIISLLDPEAGEELFRLIQRTSQVAAPFRY
uniref:Tetratricopeptide repeat protein n=1 Tax=Desulfobacca acetoxidans TaxID=60893 RepID=A0A7C5ENJ1_9BACT